MATKIKHTWWGDQWLNSLKQLDYNSRLQTAKSYAAKGAVVSLSTWGNTIHANVRDTRKRPYSVSIEMNNFAPENKEAFIQQLKENNLLILSMLDKELPQELLPLATTNNLKLLPDSMSDMKATCNCQERNIPCKHVSATLIMLANEIDKDPYLIFKIHHMDIVNELRQQKIVFGYQGREKIYSFRDCLETSYNPHNWAYNRVLPIIPPYAGINNLLPTIPELFISKTIFFTADFKTYLHTIYRKAAKMAMRYNPITTEEGVVHKDDLCFYDYTIIFFYDNELVIEAKSRREKVILTREQLMALFARTETKHLDNYSVSYIALYKIYRYCKVLVEKGAILPRLFNGGADDFKILWVPALLNESVKNIYDKLVEFLPYRMLMLASSSVSRSNRGNIGRTGNISTKIAEKSEGLQLLCANFINHQIAGVYTDNHFAKNMKEKDRKILDLFFGNTPKTFHDLHELQVPNAIQLWLKRFYSADQHFTPIIQVTEGAKKDGFEVEILVQHNKTELKEKETLQSFLDTNETEHRMLMLKELNLLAEYYPDLHGILESIGKKTLHYAAESFSNILLKILPVLKLFGIQVLLPKSLQSIMKPMVSLNLTTAKNKKTYFSLDGLMDYNWQVAMGDTFISQAEFEMLSQTTMGLVRIKDQYILMDELQVKKIIQHLNKPARLTGIDLLQAALSGDYEHARVFIDETLKQQIVDLLKDEEIALPTNLLATLRPYQLRGFNWIYKNSKLGIGSLLADDMGLGKTLQVITAILKFKEEGLLKKSPALVIVPTTLLTNWQIEMKRFAPDLRVLIFHGHGRALNLENIDVVVTTYGIARTENQLLCNQKWYVVVVDEAQNIKNPDIAQTKSIKKIKGTIKIAMSGTPVENRLSEYWSIFDFANPSYLGSNNWFGTNYAKPIELYQDSTKLTKFKAITAPFVLRRLKTDKHIIDDLPDKIENNQFCTLTKEQAALYQNLTHDLMKQIQASNGMSRRGMVLKLLTVLKQICNHPANYLKNADQHPGLSGKTLLLLQLLETIYENNEKVIIFSQYQEMGTILKEIIYKHFGKTALQLHGGSSRNDRDEMVETFQNDQQTDTFILSIKAGGTGLNLTAAANVIHFDLWWNPAVEAQATDRAFRIGQDKNVMVHRMITKGTLEEKIDLMLQSKKQLSDIAVAHGEMWVGELSDKELNELISFGEEGLEE